MAETQNDPLLPGYSFNAHLVAGLTPIEANGYLDFFIDRPLGMKGYILNLTIRGEGVINNQGKQFVCRPGDILLFPPGEIHHYAIPNCWRLIYWNSYCSDVWKPLMNRYIPPWTTACATPVSTSAITWRTVILILPASHSTSACRLPVCRICSVSSWVSAY